MKRNIFKFLLSAAAVAFICNCGEDMLIDGSNNNSIPVVSKRTYLFKDGSTTYLIDVDGYVTNENGDTIGAANFQTGQIIGLDLNVLAENIDFNTLDAIDPTIIVGTAWVFSADRNYVIYHENGIVTDANANPVGTFILDVNPETGEPLSTGKIVDLAGNVLYEDVDVSELETYQANTGNTNITPTPDPIITSSASDFPLPEAALAKFPIPVRTRSLLQ